MTSEIGHRKSVGQPALMMALNVPCVHEAPEPTEGRHRGFHASHERYPFTARVASGRKAALREMSLLDAVSRCLWRAKVSSKRCLPGCFHA